MRRPVRLSVGLAAGLCILMPSAASADGSISIGNSLRYSLSSETNQEILEDYFDADYSHGSFRARLRYEVFQPSEEQRDREGQVFRAVGGTTTWGSLWVGNFYELFGRGMAFHGYEDRDLRVDNSLDGVDLNLEHGPVAFQAFSGKTPGKTVVLHGMDGDLRLPLGIEAGGSYLSRRQTSSTGYNSPDLELGTGRMRVTAGPVDIFVEGGRRSKSSAPEGGRGLFASIGASVPGAALGLEYKDYRHMGVGAEGKEYTTPPPASVEHRWSLLARHSRDLNADDERGGLAQLEWQPSGLVGLSGAFSLTENHDSDRLFDAKRLFSEAMAEARIAELSSTPVTVAAAWTEEFLGPALTTSGPVDDRREHVTFIAEVTFPVQDPWSGRVSVEHQHTDGDAVGAFDLEHIEIEASRSPGISIAAVAEFSNVSAMQRDLPWLPVFEDETAWFYLQGIVDIVRGHQLRVILGSRPQGKVCAGGACRTVPEFKGLEVQLTSMF
ncbi:hypothetical protein JXA88_00660 [Candidatus Fermentibacteria bacterium]|nr:hypothetical protein [Candidatus Fermentibacteria bacterium]